jgi:RHS repeat-associated protein
MHFTGKQHDYESGLDNFGARYYGSSDALGRFTSSDPSNLSVDFWLPQTWNRYAYTLNNPLSMVDRNGQWPSYIHNMIDEEAFPGLSKEDLDTIEKASSDMDYHNDPSGLGVGPQDQLNSEFHGMSTGDLYDTNPMEAISESEAGGDQFIQSQLAEARTLQAQWTKQGHSGLSPAALTKFGNALHTAQDMTSPSHRGYQPWHGPWTWRTPKHFFQEAWATPETRGPIAQASYHLFMWTFGQCESGGADDWDPSTNTVTGHTGGCQ